ncbi:unnamed protein product, partial [Laminaria digitata]
AGPITEAFRSAVEGRAEMKWKRESVDVESEILREVRFDLVDGRVFLVDEMELGFEGEAFNLKLTDIDMRPRNTTLLLHADEVLFTGGAHQIRHILDGKIFASTCDMTGTSKMEVTDFGYIDAAPLGSIEEDSKYRIMNLLIDQKNTGPSSACRSDFDVILQGVDFRPSGEGQLVSDVTKVKFTIPGSLESLAADRSQIARIDIETRETSRKIIGGASAWSILDGTVSLQVEAISLV